MILNKQNVERATLVDEYINIAEYYSIVDTYIMNNIAKIWIDYIVYNNLTRKLQSQHMSFMEHFIV